MFVCILYVCMYVYALSWGGTVLDERMAWWMSDVRRGRRKSTREERAREWGRRGEEEDCLRACWVAECRQLEEELMGMVSARSGVTGESFSTLPLPAPRLSSLWNSAPPAPTLACVCFKPRFIPFPYFFFSPHSIYLSPLTKKVE